MEQIRRAAAVGLVIFKSAALAKTPEDDVDLKSPKSGKQTSQGRGGGTAAATSTTQQWHEAGQNATLSE